MKVILNIFFLTFSNIEVEFFKKTYIEVLYSNKGFIYYTIDRAY